MHAEIFLYLVTSGFLLLPASTQYVVYDVAEEGSRHDISRYVIASHVTSASWSQQLQGGFAKMLSTCTSLDDGSTFTCSNSEPSEYLIQEPVVNKNFILTILNVSREGQGPYVLNVSGDSDSLYTYDLNVYAKPESPRCDPPTLTADNRSLSVTCSTDKVFPKAQCDFHRHGFPYTTEIIDAMKEIIINYPENSETNISKAFSAIFSRSDKEIIDGMKETMINYHENSETNISKAFSAIFSRFECCGVTNYSYDFQNGTSTNHTRGFVFAPERPSNYAQYYIIPITCCKGFDYKAELTPTIFTEHKDCITRPNPTNAYTSHCFDKIKGDIKELGRILLHIGETTLVSEGALSDVSYTHESYNSSDGVIYYKSTCTLTYPINTPGSHAFFVDMFVNISSIPYGLQQSPVSDSINLTLPEGGLATDCFSGDNVRDGYIKTGTTATCTCDRVPGSLPLGQVQWYDSAGQEVGTIENGGMSATLTVYANGTEQNFTCKGKSVLGVQATGVPFDLKVAYEATVETFTANQNQTLTVDLHDSINLTCVVDGTPTPTITIEDHRVTDQKRVEGHRLTYVKNNLTCTDTAVYTCRATSFPSMNESSEAQVEVFVRCPQQPRHADNTTFSATEGDSVTLDLDVIGYPAPRSYTLRQGQTVVAQVNTTDGNGESGTYQFKCLSNDPPLGTVQLTIGNLSKEQFTNYLLTVDNGVGQAVELSFILETGLTMLGD